MLIVVGGPIVYWIYSSTPPACPIGMMREEGDARGPCNLIDERTLHPVTTLWTRSFHVRGGLFNATTYVQNPNEHAGVGSVRYRFAIYDQRNILITEREGATYIMPGTVTPIFEGGIATGERVASHAYFEFIEPLAWELMNDTASVITVRERQLFDATVQPRLVATVENMAVTDRTSVEFTAVLFDPSGNAFAASQTTLPRMRGGEVATITFTWPEAFRTQVGRIEIIPGVPPTPVQM